MSLRRFFIFLIGFFAALVNTAAQTQLSIHNFQDVATASSVAANLQVSAVSVSSGTLGYQNGTDDGGTKIGNSSSWNQGNFNLTGKYLEFSISPLNSYTLALSTLSFRFGRTSSGPTAVTIAWSDDGFDQNIQYLIDSGIVSSTNENALNAFSLTSNLPGSSSNAISIRIWGHNASSTGNLRFNNFRLFGTLTAPPPVLSLQPALLTGLNTDTSRASSSRSFQLGGNHFTTAGQILLDATGTAYELSSNNSSFSNQLSITHGIGALAAQTLYVRLKSGLAVGTYNQNIAISGGGAPALQLQMQGNVSLPVVASAVGGSLRLSIDSLVFGTVNELQRDSGFVTLYNEGGSSLSGRILSFHIYNHKPFWTPDSVFSIAAGDSLRLKIYFQPRHNILNKGVLVVDVRTGTGPKTIQLRGQGSYSRAYYSSTQNLEGAALTTALRTLTGSPYTQIGYSTTVSARHRMFYIIDNWKVNGRDPAHNEGFKNECVYTGRFISYNSEIGTGTLNNSPYLMNTEHTWPQSQGADPEPMKSDLHHLFITDGATNSARGNKPLGWVSSPTLTYTGGSKANSVVFEPRDVHKGAAARALLYFAMRYGNLGTTNLGFIAPYEADLREWHALYPPTAIDRKRNDDVQTYQLNRNPFVDYPQLLDRIADIAGGSSTPVLRGFYVPDSLIGGKISQGQARSYQLPVVNTGNQNITLSNISVTGSGLTYGGTSGTTLAPGERILLSVEMNFASTNSVSGHLQFNTDVAGRTSVVVPLQITIERSRWNGTGNWTQQANWNNGFVPVSSSQPLIESGSAQLNDTLSVTLLEVASGASLQINGQGGIRTSGNLINNGSIIIEADGSLRPGNNASVLGNGSYAVKRNGQSSNLRINFWSSPVENANLATTFPAANPLDIRQFDPGNNTVAAWQVASGTMTAGRGYTVAGAGAVTFNGKIHHGEYIPVSTNGTTSGWYLIGNPYPAPLDADAFLAFNGPAGTQAIGGSLYFWAQQQNATGSNFSNGDYAIWAGGTGTAGSGSNLGSQTPSGQIASGQGFFVSDGGIPASLQVIIKNDMRSSSRNGQFFRTGGPVGRLWLKALGENQTFSQLAIVLRDDATAGFDPQFDAPRLATGAGLAFSSEWGGSPFAIQALPWPIHEQEIPLHLQLAAGTLVTLALDSLAGIDSNVGIYLEDRAKNRFFNLRQDSLIFRPSAGPHANRFFLHLRKQNISTSIEKLHSTDSEIEIYAHQKRLYFNALPVDATVQVYNVAGQLIHQHRPQAAQYEMALPEGGRQIWMVRVISSQGSLSRKLLD
ncbi:MAG: endonuclease [Sphingobacteriaceae bacterium]|nr:endonuclease [Sphingobacteriaceae bacterium]